MFQNKAALIALIASLCVISANAQAQPAANCQAVTGLTAVNATELAGTWFEVASAPASQHACVQFYIKANNETVNVTSSYSSTNSSYYMDKSVVYTASTTQVNANAGFNITNNATNASETIKILQTTSNGLLSACSYTNASDPTTAVYFVLSRVQFANGTQLSDAVTSANSTVSGFINVANVTQSTSCYASSASTSVPVLTSVFALFYAILKFIH